MTTLLIINLAAFAFLLFLISKTPKGWTLSKRVLFGFIIGVFFGLALKFIYSDNDTVLSTSIRWFDVVGNGYIQLLQMIVMPLVFVSILSAVTRLNDASALGKIGVLTIGTLLVTTAIAALVGVFVTKLFGLTAEGLLYGTQEAARLDAIQTHYIGKVADLSLPDFLISLIPKNPFAELTGARPTSIISVVVFAVFLGVAALQLKKENDEKGQTILNAINSLQCWVMKLVRVVMSLTPYGVMALILKMTISTEQHHLIKLAGFIIASYLGFIIMFGIHGLLLTMNGIHPARFFRKVWPVLSFAFTSRSSAAAIPLSIETQINRLGVPNTIASFSASFGATIGQNGCAGIYPSMLAAMIAPMMGINPLDPAWLATLVGIVTLSSVGVAGVGGGATFAALIVLPAMGLPVTLIALLISVEPLIDMGRTALNVNGSMTAGTLTSRWLKQLDSNIFNSEEQNEKTDKK